MLANRHATYSNAIVNDRVPQVLDTCQNRQTSRVSINSADGAGTGLGIRQQRFSPVGVMLFLFKDLEGNEQV